MGIDEVTGHSGLQGLDSQLETSGTNVRHPQQLKARTNPNLPKALGKGLVGEALGRVAAAGETTTRVPEPQAMTHRINPKGKPQCHETHPEVHLGARHEGSGINLLMGRQNLGKWARTIANSKDCGVITVLT